MSHPTLEFASFQLDLRAGQLCRGGTPLPLRPKTFAVLQHLVQRPGELVTKRALLDAVWGDVAVTEDVVRLSVGELRTALGDARAAPRFIETVPRRGYRFVAAVGAAGMAIPQPPALPAGDDSSAGTGTVVGRRRECAEIAEWLRLASSGRRQIGFVTGETGIGKTTLVEAALRDLRRTSGARLRIARGQCVEHYGDGDPYLPVLDAIGGLGRGSDAPAIQAALRAHAPDWLLHLLVPMAPGLEQRPESAARTPERTLQLLAASLDALAAETPLVLVLEDMQWSDYSTLDLLSLVARRREAARLLVVCTLRPADAIVRGHPVAGVKRELLRSGLCREIMLEGLSAADIASYLAARFPGADLAEDILPFLVERSEGNPFFLVALVDHLLDQQLLVRDGSRWRLDRDVEPLRASIPEGLRAVIEPRLDRLAGDELRVLEAASVAGLEFAAHAVAQVAPPGSDLADIEYVEQLCDGLVRRQEMLRAAGESTSPDGTTSSRYGFRHKLQQQMIDERLSPSMRRRFHQTLGERLEAAYGGRTAEIASELAVHFERSRDVERAVRYHGEAAAQARSRFAYQETRLHLEAALRLMGGQPETPEGLRREMLLLDGLAWTSSASKGWADEAGARAFARMRELAEHLDATLARFKAMEGQLVVHTMRAEYATARARGEEMLLLGEQLGNRAAVANALPALGAVLLHLGELEAAHAIAARGRAACDPDAPTIQGISSCNLLAVTCVHRGLVAQARAASRESIALAERTGVPYCRAHAASFGAAVCALLRDVPETRALAEAAVDLASACGFSALRVRATIFRGWCDVQEGRVAEGLAVVRDALAEFVASGERISTSSYRLRLAEAYLASDDSARAREVLAAALAFASEADERIYEHELYRLQGECLLAGGTGPGRKAAAMEAFERAIAIAAGQKALLFELRATTSLYRLRTSARERLERLVERFEQESDCEDLRAARAMLDGRPR